MGLYFMYDKLARGWSREGTLTGKYHIVYLFLFRVLILFTVGRKIYEDELTAFRCNTIQPGCTTMCFNAVFPISHLRFWYFQIVVTLMPYFAFGAYVMVTSDDDVKNTEEQTIYVQNIPMTSLEQITSSRRALSTNPDSFPMKKLYAIRKGFLSHEDIYEIQCVVRMVLEVVFLCLQQLLFGFEVAATIQCEEFPCPRKIRCHPAKTTEKSFMLAYSFCVGVVSVCFGVYEFISMRVEKKEKTTAAPPQDYDSLSDTFNCNIECEDRLRYDEDDNTITSDSTISDHSSSDSDPSDDESEEDEFEDDGYGVLDLQTKDRCKRRYNNADSESGSSTDGDTERGDDVSDGSHPSSEYEYGFV